MRHKGVIGVLICGLVAIVVRLVVKLLTRRRGSEVRFPPGPFALPVLGHLYLFSYSSLPHQALAAVSKKYGPLLGLRLGQQRAVVASSPEAAREVLLTHDKLFAHRPPLLFNSIMLFGARSGVIFNSLGPQWRAHRKLCTLQLFTAKRLREQQHVRQQEIRALLLSIHRHHSAWLAGTAPTPAIDLGNCVGQMSSRLVMHLLQSRATAQIGGENLQQLIKDMEHEVAPNMGDLLPSFSILDFFRNQRMRRMHARLDKVYTQILIERRKESASFHDDLLHSLLSQQAELTVVEIKAILHDLIAAGIHTTVLILEWAMAELLKSPHRLHRLQREIDAHVGEKKEVSEADLPSLSYLKCIVKEVFRLHPVVPLLVPRLSTEECELQGYIIPAKTLVLVNVWAIGRDERVWPHPNEFMPERFEGKEVDVKGQHFELLPFGSGRRSCLGMPLALPVVEVTLANLVSYFDWELPYGETHTSLNMDERSGMAANKATPVMAIPKPRVSISKLQNL